MRVLGVDCANVIFYPWRMEAVSDSIKSLQVLARSNQFEKIYLVSRATILTQIYYRFRLRNLNLWELTGIPKKNLHFCWRNKQKAVICRRLGITDFVDDRLTVLRHMDNDMHLFAFRPSDEDVEDYPDVLVRAKKVASWSELVTALLKE